MKKGIVELQADKGVLCNADFKQTKYKLLYGGLVLYILIHFAIVIVPVLWMVLSGFKEPVEIVSRSQSFFPKQISLKKFTDLWSQLKFYHYYFNTFVMAAGCVVFDVVVNGLAGYVLSRLKPRGSGIYFTLILCIMLIPTTASMVPNYMLFKQMGMLNTYWPIFFLQATNIFNILLFKTSFDNISTSLVEAAKIDGASNMRIFRSIVIPLSVPVIVTVSLFTFNGQFGNFFWPYLLISDPNRAVLGIKVYELRSSTLSLDKQMLVLLFAVIPQLIIFVLFQKHIVGGINVGGVKG